MKTALLHFGLAVSALLLVIGAYALWYNRVAALSHVAARLTQTIEAKQEIARRIATARQALAALQGEERDISGYFITEESIVALIGELEARGRAQGSTVAVTSVSTTKLDKRPAFSVQLVISGTFDSVMRTAGAIEYMPKYLKVTLLSLDAAERGNWTATLALAVGAE